MALVPLLLGCDLSRKASGQIIIATGGDYPPWNFARPDGTIGGYEVELIAVLCKRMQVSCKIVTQDFDGIIPGLILHRYDAIMSSLGVTEERRKVVAFSVPYARSPIGMVTTSRSQLSQLSGGELSLNLTKSTSSAAREVAKLRAALKGKAIGVQIGTTSENFANAYFSDLNLVRYPTFAHVEFELTTGRIDVAFDNITAIRAMIAASPTKALAAAGPTFSGGVIGIGTTNIAFRPSDEALKSAFDHAITSVNRDGTNKILAQKWFGRDISIHDAGTETRTAAETPNLRAISGSAISPCVVAQVVPARCEVQLSKPHSTTESRLFMRLMDRYNINNISD